MGVPQVGYGPGYSPQYLAPELLSRQQQGALITSKADMWAFGATLVHMLAGRAPFAGLQAMQVARLVVEQQQTPGLPLQLAAWPALRQLLEECFAHNPSARPTAAGALAQLAAISAQVWGYWHIPCWHQCVLLCTQQVFELLGGLSPPL